MMVRMVMQIRTWLKNGALPTPLMLMIINYYRSAINQQACKGMHSISNGEENASAIKGLESMGWHQTYHPTLCPFNFNALQRLILAKVREWRAQVIEFLEQVPAMIQQRYV